MDKTPRDFPMDHPLKYSAKNGLKNPLAKAKDRANYPLKMLVTHPALKLPRIYSPRSSLGKYEDYLERRNLLQSASNLGSEFRI